MWHPSGLRHGAESLVVAARRHGRGDRARGRPHGDVPLRRPELQRRADGVRRRRRGGGGRSPRQPRAGRVRARDGAVGGSPEPRPTAAGPVRGARAARHAGGHRAAVGFGFCAGCGGDAGAADRRALRLVDARCHRRAPRAPLGGGRHRRQTRATHPRGLPRAARRGGEQGLPPGPRTRPGPRAEGVGALRHRHRGRHPRQPLPPRRGGGRHRVSHRRPHRPRRGHRRRRPAAHRRGHALSAARGRGGGAHGPPPRGARRARRPLRHRPRAGARGPRRAGRAHDGGHRQGACLSSAPVRRRGAAGGGRGAYAPARGGSRCPRRRGGRSG